MTPPTHTDDDDNIVDPSFAEDLPKFPDGGDEAPLESHTYLRVLASGVAAALAESSTYPFDFVKTQMQAQRLSRPVEEFGTGSTQMGFKEIHVFRKLDPAGAIRTAERIVHRDGVLGFYRGLPAALMRAVFNNGLSLALYKPLLRLVTGRDIHDRRPFHSELRHKLTAAFLTGGLSQLIANPVDIIKVRLQVESLRSKPRFRSTAGACQHIYRTGFLNFWTGLGPSFTRSALAVGSTIATYDHTKHWIMDTFQVEDGMPLHVASSATSGLVASFASCPADVLKTRIMTQSLTNPEYRTVMRCLMAILKNEGPMTLFRGFLPTYIRLGPWQVVFFTSFERISLLLGGSTI
ncbi:Mitochondrial carrier protein [Plasmodiophora brassicae]